MNNEERKCLIMMNNKECAKTWKTITKIYEETRIENNPRKTMDQIVMSVGMDATKEAFATVAAIKKHDGRIYGTNRKYMNSIPVNPEAVERKSENPVIYAGLDDIHTTHINQLITELRNLDN